MSKRLTKLTKKKAPSEPSSTSKLKKVKPLKIKTWGQDKDVDMHLHLNFMEYLKTKNLRRYGNAHLDADNQGYDGYDTLRLLDHLKVREDARRIEVAFTKRPNDFMKAATYNAWQWANFCSRLWTETIDMQPPTRRLVNIDLSDLFPGAAYGSLTKFFQTKDTDLWHALGNLGLLKTRVRLIFSIRDEWQVKNQILYKLFDSLKMVNSEKSIWGIMLDIDKAEEYTNYPRDVVILYPSNLRKSKDAEAYLDEAIENGYRVVLPFEALQGKSKTVKEIRQSAVFSKLVQSWKNLQPITTLPIDSSMGRVSKVSKLCDVLLV